MDTYYISLVYRKKTIWEVSFEDKELAAGILAVGSVILEEINFAEKKRYFFNSNLDISSFILEKGIVEEEITAKSRNKLFRDQYGIWLRSTSPYLYNLYGFYTNSFFQGIISISHAFSVDFRDYRYGLPFDAYGDKYTLSGYVMTPYQMTYDAPDLGDVEEEEKDNEKIIEPLVKDY